MTRTIFSDNGTASRFIYSHFFLCVLVCCSNIYTASLSTPKGVTGPTKGVPCRGKRITKECAQASSPDPRSTRPLCNARFSRPPRRRRIPFSSSRRMRDIDFYHASPRRSAAVSAVRLALQQCPFFAFGRTVGASHLTCGPLWGPVGGR